MTGKRHRADGEGSIFPYRNGYAAYVWVTTPTGKRDRKYIYGKDREDVHDRWIKLQAKAKEGPVATSVPTLAAYLEEWLKDVVRPGLSPKTAESYAMHVRLHIVPGIGKKRLDKLTVSDTRKWLNKLAITCQCCVQGKDLNRPTKKQCCSIGRCCEQFLSRRTIQDIRAVLRSALSSAMTDELIARNVAALVKLPRQRRRRTKPWSVEEARRFLESAKTANDPMYAAYVLILVLGLRRGEALGLTWPEVDLDNGELTVLHSLARVNGRLVLGDTKTDASEALLPLPDVCRAALVQRQAAQKADKAALKGRWPDPVGLVFTTRYGSPIDPRNFVRSFKNRCARAGVRPIRVHDTRHTCGSLLAALDVHPRVAMQILRHSKIDVTMEIYTHVPSELTRAALKKLGQSLDGLAS